MSGRRRRWVALAVLGATGAAGAAGAAACGGGRLPAGAELSVLAGSELRDIEPFLPQIRKNAHVALSF